MKDCNQCGKCCIKYGGSGLHVEAEELDWWAEHRPAIARFAVGGKIWRDPQSGQPLEQCPWLRRVPGEDRYLCDIYYDRPNDCREYPSLVSEMIRDECEMIEVQDLTDLASSQKRLNRLMERE